MGDFIKGRNNIVDDLSVSPQGLKIKVSQLGNVSSTFNEISENM